MNLLVALFSFSGVVVGHIYSQNIRSAPKLQRPRNHLFFYFIQWPYFLVFPILFIFILHNFAQLLQFPSFLGFKIWLLIASQRDIWYVFMLFYALYVFYFICWAKKSNYWRFYFIFINSILSCSCTCVMVSLVYVLDEISIYEGVH